ncbi:unnamed protein product, partial [Closterium sp. NIES-64]
STAAGSSSAAGGEASSLRSYLLCIRHTLHAALCLQEFPCQDVERYSKPEVEFRTSPELLLNPVVICRNESERCLIEGSINSVRVSIKVKHADEMENLLGSKYLSFLSMRAESFLVLRRKPLPGYDLSFLITAEHCQSLHKHRLVDFVVRFLQDMHRDMAELKEAINASGRVVAADFFKQFL